MSSDVNHRLLHRALCDGEPTAPRRLVSALSRPLRTLLRKSFPVVPDEVIDDAVTDALLALIKTPERYDPRQSSLLNYLARIGHNKLVDALREWARHRNLHFVGGTVELAQIEENNYREGPAQTDHSAEDTLPPEVEQLLYTILPDPTDRCVWDLICQGRTAVADFAEVLSITHLPAEQQRAEVKRHRDRVQKRVRRRQDAFRRLL